MGEAGSFIFFIIFLTSYRPLIGQGSRSQRSSNAGDECLPIQFKCNDGMCLPPSWWCDGREDCSQGEDEPAGCKEQGFECFNGPVIPMTSVCDGIADCTNGEDEEQDCQAFECSNGETLQASSVCDGRIDCDGGDDEDAKQCLDSNRSPCDELECEDRTQCLSNRNYCNGRQDCGDGSDEAYCPQRNTDDCFSCDGGTRCIRYKWLCDEFIDCVDQTDESNVMCPSVTERCWRGAFRCAHRNFCVLRRYRCDGVNDCGDGSDEARCRNTAYWADVGGWSRWSPWSECSASCGAGTWSRRRICYPQVQCEGDDIETEACEEMACTNTTHYLSESGDVLQLGCGIRHISGHGPPSTRIIGGDTSVAGSWPWQAQLWFKYRRNNHILACGGTLISERIVLTAAHCFLHYRGKEAARWTVDLGKESSSRRIEADKGHHRSGVMVIYHYDSFSAFDLWQDIAIMLLRNPVPAYSSKISPACVDNGNVNVDDGDPLCYSTGFGVTQVLTGQRARHLQEARLPIINHDICNHPDVYNHAVSEDMFCAGFLEGQVDACKGDSGGPYICHQPGEDRWYQVGITSWGHGCALKNKPGVYTNVTHFGSWIDNIVNRVIPQFLSRDEENSP